MQGLITILFYRLFTLKALFFIAILIIINILIYRHYLYGQTPLINLLSDAENYAILYFYESLFFLKVTSLLLIVVFSYLLYGSSSMDIALISKVSKSKVHITKFLVLLMVLICVTLMSLIMMMLIYSFSAFSIAYDISVIVYLHFLIFITYYTAISVLLVSIRPSLYPGLCLILTFLLSEVVYDISQTSHPLINILTLIFPTIKPFNEGVSLSVNSTVIMVLSVIFFTYSFVMQHKKEY